MKIRKITAVLCAFAVALALSACGSSASPETQGDDALSSKISKGEEEYNKVMDAIGGEKITTAPEKNEASESSETKKTNNPHTKKKKEEILNKDGYEYVVCDDHVEIVKYTKKDTPDIEVPSEIDGLPVTVIRKKAFVGKGLVSVVFPEGIETFEDELFYSCGSLKSVSLPSTLKNIGYGIFYECKSLTDVTLADGIPCIGDNMFLKCESLAEITIPDSVTVIRGGAFRETAVESIVIPDSVTEYTENSFGGNCFSGCNNLKSVTLSKNAKVLPSSMFGGSSDKYLDSLEKIVIPEGVEEIGSKCFRGATSLKEIEIPSTVKVISEDAFVGTPWYETAPSEINGIKIK